MIPSLYSVSQRQSEFRLVITKPAATNCFNINFLVFINNNQPNCKYTLQTYCCIKNPKSYSIYSYWPVIITSEKVNLEQLECSELNGHLEIYTKCH